MEVINDILKVAGTAVVSGSIAWVLTIRYKVRRERNDTDAAEFDAVSKVVNQAMQDLNQLSQRVGELELEKAKMMQEFSRLKTENEALMAENKRLTDAVRQYMKKNNPNLLP